MKTWIPRGRIYHTVSESFKYLFFSCFLPLKLSHKLKSEVEQEFAESVNRAFCTVFPSARIALYYTLKSLQLPPKSIIITPPITIKPMLDIIYASGLKPKFVDLNLHDFSFDLDELDESITPDTRVVFLTYLFGHVPDLKRLHKIIKKHNLILIEDFSQALGAIFEDKKIGCIGDVSIYSASSIKTLDTLGGGYAVTNSRDLHNKLESHQRQLLPPSRKSLVTKACSNLFRNLATTPMIFSIFTSHVLRILRFLKYEGTYRMTGTRNQNPVKAIPPEWFRSYSAVQARIAKEQLASVQDKTKKRLAVVEQILGNDFSKTVLNGRNSVYWQLCVVASNLAEVKVLARLRKLDISQTSLSLIAHNRYFPDSSYCMKAQYIYDQSFFIPCYPHLTKRHLSRLTSFYRDLSRP